MDRSKLRNLVVTTHCEMPLKESPSPGEFLEGLCYEPPAWAVQFTGKPVSRNQIFTQGFAVHIAGAERLTPRPPDAREAFGHALTMWVSALQRIHSELEPELKIFLEKSIARSPSGYMLITPPQAVRRYCRSMAMFQVQWIAERGRAFPEGDQHVLAKAQFQGRTVLLNGVDHAFNMDLRFVRAADGRHSLVSIMAHELGHAFGLGHDDSGAASIMSSRSSTMSREPTDTDARALARALLLEVRGKEPGDIRFAECQGLRAD